MKNTLQRIVLGAVLAGAAIGITSCGNNYLSSAYKRIEASNLSKEQKMNLKELYSSINLNKLSTEEKEFLRLDDKQKRETFMPRILELYTQNRIIDSNNITPLDYMVMGKTEEYIVLTHFQPSNN